jgi:PAS domain-containing protein
MPQDMYESLIIDLIKNSKESLAFVKPNGSIIVCSSLFEKDVQSIFPHNNNIVKLLMSRGEVSIELFEMHKYNFLDVKNFPFIHSIKNKIDFKIHLEKTIRFKDQDCLLLRFDYRKTRNDKHIEFIINSDNLFINCKTPSLIFSDFEQKTIAINEKAKNIRQLYFNNESKAINDFEGYLKNIVAKTKVGGVSEDVYEPLVRNVRLSFKVYSSKIVDGYYQINIEDISYQKKRERLLSLQQKRIEIISEIVPGAIFEFEFDENQFNFKYVSPSISKILGFSAEEIIKNPDLVLSRLDRIQRAKLHLYLTNSDTISLKSISSDFKIKDSNDQVRIYGIDWHGKVKDDGLVYGGGYINDLTERRKIESDRQKSDRIKYLKEFFSLTMLKSDNIDIVFFNLVKSAVNKLKLENCVIYKYNSNQNKFELSASYINSEMIQSRQDFSVLPIKNKLLFDEILITHKNIVNNNLLPTQNSNDSVLSQIALPIVFEGEIFGVIYSSYSQKLFFDEDVVDVFQNISNTLSWRVTQLSRNKIDNIYRNSLNTIFSKGKIFEFKYYYQNQSLSNASLDNFINLLSIVDRY